MSVPAKQGRFSPLMSLRLSDEGMSGTPLDYIETGERSEKCHRCPVTGPPTDPLRSARHGKYSDDPRLSLLTSVYSL